MDASAHNAPNPRSIKTIFKYLLLRVYRSPDLAVFANITMNGANAEIANVGTIIVGVDNVLKIPAIASLHWA